MNRRLSIIFTFFILLVGVIVVKLYFLQIKKGEYYEVLALGQQIFFDEVIGKRGDIFFKGGKVPLAQTKEKIIVRVVPEKIKKEDLDKTVEFLSEISNQKKDDLLTIFKKGSFKMEISDATAKKMKEQDFEGVYINEVMNRFYPQDELASNVVGFVNDEGEGQYGAEGYYDKTLRGEKGMLGSSKSPFGYLASFFSPEEQEVQQKGASIWLTLDYNIQYFAEKALKEAKEKWNIDSGQVIVLEPSTGKILALANFPNFNPNQYSDEKKLEVFLNGSIQKLFEPGSVFKPITMAGGLEEGLVTPETKYEDKGFVNFGGPPIYNFNRRVWGEQTMTDVLEESINTGVIFVEEKLGKNLFLKYLEEFGFFEKTDIDLQGEVFSLNERLKQGYHRDIAVTSFGQGIEITPMQLVRAFGAIANGGKMMKPFIIEKIIEPDGKEIIIQPQMQKTVLSAATAQKLTSMLVNVVKQGSARRTKIDGYFIAGKTGTAQVSLSKKKGYSEDETVQSFVGFFPAFEPRALVLVKLDNPKEVTEASRCAVPLARDLIQDIINLWQIPPADNHINNL